MSEAPYYTHLRRLRERERYLARVLGAYGRVDERVLRAFLRAMPAEKPNRESWTFSSGRKSRLPGRDPGRDNS